MSHSSTRSDVVYQKMINNTLGDEVLDIRVPIIKGTVPFVYLKYRRLTSRFSNKNIASDGRIPWCPFSLIMRSARIKQFAEKLGLDFGELDVLRDVDNGKIYIVDVNNTPCGPPNHLAKAESARAIQILSDSFNTVFFARTT